MTQLIIPLTRSSRSHHAACILFTPKQYCRKNLEETEQTFIKPCLNLKYADEVTNSVVPIYFRDLEELAEKIGNAKKTQLDKQNTGKLSLICNQNDYPYNAPPFASYGPFPTMTMHPNLPQGFHQIPIMTQIPYFNQHSYFYQNEPGPSNASPFFGGISYSPFHTLTSQPPTYGMPTDPQFVQQS